MRAPSAPRCACASLACALLVGSGSAARADPPTVEARAAYDRGTAAFDRGEFGVAAHAYARADELAPNSVALEAALNAAVRASDAELAMELCDRSAREAPPPSLAQLVKLARERFSDKTGRLGVVCPAGATCTAEVDGTPMTVGASRWFTAGSHELVLSVNGHEQRRNVSIVGGSSVEIEALAVTAPAAAAPTAATGSVTAPAPPSAPATADASGVSPAWFWMGAGLTAVAGGITIASGADAVAKHNTYLQDPNPTTESVGRAAETRTNVMIAITAGTALATAAVGLFVVRWSPSAARSLARGELSF